MANPYDLFGLAVTPIDTNGVPLTSKQILAEPTNGSVLLADLKSQIEQSFSGQVSVAQVQQTFAASVPKAPVPSTTVFQNTSINSTTPQALKSISTSTPVAPRSISTLLSHWISFL